MCDFANYPEMYFNAGYLLRRSGIKPLVPGFELLRRALVVYKVSGPGPNFLKQVRNGMVIPSNEIKKKKREPEVQWMVEAMKMENIDIPLMEYIETLAEQL